MTKMSDTGFLKRKTRRSFAVGGLFAVFVVFGWHWLHSSAPDQEISWPLRRVLELNGRISHSLFSEGRINHSPAPPRGKLPRFNGSIGIEDEVDLKTYRLEVYNGDLPTNGGAGPVKRLSARELRFFPRTGTSAEFRCIEGWSDPISYAGVRFKDFIEQTGVGRKPDGSFYRYVGLMTPDEEYYVSIDIESMLHPQTLLADEMNGAPLLPRDGAPLRLVIPVKYGIKSLKRVGKIWFSDRRPPDYWAERGYDWFAGL